MKKILVIDGNSIINRAFFGIKPLTTKSGKFTNAIYGMVNIISKQLNAVKPDYAAVAFDVKHPTFRHNIYTEYKAGRKPTPPELLSQFPDAKEILEYMGIKVLELPGWEADDIQGTVAKMAWDIPEAESYILSGDRDLLQLIDDRVSVLLATNSDTITYHRDEFFAKYGVEPSEFVDMKALMGDSSDNIPGVAGVGEKTAASLIQGFKNLEGIYENIEDKSISKGVREKLLRDKENAYLSRTLAKIACDAPIGIKLEDLEYKGFNTGALYQKFSELELNSFITKFSLTKAPTSEPTVTQSEETFESPKFKEIDAKYLNSLKFDNFSLHLGANNDFYLYINGENLLYNGKICNIKTSLEDKEIICYDGKALCHLLRKNGVNCDKIVFLDLCMYEYVLNPGSGSAGIPSLASMFLGIAVSGDEPCPEIMQRLEDVLRKRIVSDGLDKILFEIEIPLINVLCDIEINGFKINSDKITEFGEALGALADELTEKIYALAGEPFNINSPKQLGEVLYEKLGLTSSKKKSKTGYHTDAQTLEEMRVQSPIIDDILEYRQVTKLKSTYTKPLTDVRDENDRIHTDFKMALTATGRLSSTEPNLQNIPIKTPLGREMRRFFISDEGYSLVDADYSQIELRLLAHISGDYNMCEAFKSGEDIHRKTAAAVFNIPEEFVSEDMRKRAKAVNFGIVYGIGGFSLAKDIGTTTQEASKYIKNYLMNDPSIDSYLTEVVERATKDGYTTTPLGRRRYIPELNASNGMLRAFGKRVAMNAPIQGAAADIMKIAMLNVYRKLKKEKLDAKIVMQVAQLLLKTAPLQSQSKKRKSKHSVECLLYLFNSVLANFCPL